MIMQLNYFFSLLYTFCKEYMCKGDYYAMKKRKTTRQKTKKQRKNVIENANSKVKENVSRNLAQDNSEKEKVNNEKNEKVEVSYVIDASITGTKEGEAFFNSLHREPKKVILTTVTITELDKLKNFHDEHGKRARRIMSMAQENPNIFNYVLIDESYSTPDECIIRYCANNKEKVVLLTGDVAMCLKAQAYGVKTQYFKQETVEQPTYVMPTTNLNSTKMSALGKVTTLYAARRLHNGKLCIMDFNNSFRSIMIESIDGKEYTDGNYELRVGDEVYMATKKDSYVAFAHYQIKNLLDEDNCILIFSRRIYNSEDIPMLPKAKYKSFMRDFKRRHPF